MIEVPGGLAERSPVTFIVHRRCPTVNDWHGGPRWKYAALLKTWMREFPPCTGGRARKGSRRRVTVTRVYPKAPGQKRFDPDNLRGGIKPILDALKATGWIWNDHPSHTDVPDPQQRHPYPGESTDAFTIVEVLDLRAHVSMMTLDRNLLRRDTESR